MENITQKLKKKKFICTPSWVGVPFAPYLVSLLKKCEKKIKIKKFMKFFILIFRQFGWKKKNKYFWKKKCIFYQKLVFLFFEKKILGFYKIWFFFSINAYFFSNQLYKILETRYFMKNFFLRIIFFHTFWEKQTASKHYIPSFEFLLVFFF